MKNLKVISVLTLLSFFCANELFSAAAPVAGEVLDPDLP
jgi:hypothetical protein